MQQEPQEPERIAANTPDLTGVLLGNLFLVALIGGTLWILRPFLASLLWAVTIVVATWPLLLILERRLFGRRGLAVAAMTFGLLLVLVLPVTMAIGTLVTNADTLIGWAGVLSTLQLPPPPDWLERIPLLGGQIAGLWQQFGELSNHELFARAAPYADNFLGWLLHRLGNLGFIVVQFLLTVLVAAIVYVHGEELGRFVLRFARRVAGERGESAVQLAAQAVRGVALGVVGTALIQAAMTGIGLAIAGIPFTGLLTAAAFLLTVAQLPVLTVLAPALIWLYMSDGSLGMLIFLGIWSIFVSSMDNFIRPLLIKRGVDMSLVLIFAGVIGGMLTFGIIGIFVGPALLAVSWTLLRVWVGEEAPVLPDQ